MAEMKKTTDKQKRFLREYLKDHNATQAAIRAGYAEKGATAQGSYLLTYPHLQHELQRLKKIRNDALQIDANWVLKKLIEVHERCMQKEPVFNKDDERTGEYKFDATNANKALDLIGKHVNIQAYNENSTMHHIGADGKALEWVIKVINPELTEPAPVLKIADKTIV